MPIEIKAAIAAVRREIDAATSEISRLESERAAVATAPPAAPDLHAVIDRWVEQQASEYRRGLAELMGGFIVEPLGLDSALIDGRRPYLQQLLSWPTAQGQRIDAPAAHVGALCLAIGGQIRAALRAEADALLAATPAGLPLVQRRAKLAELDGLISKKRAELHAMRAEASAAGVNLV